MLSHPNNTTFLFLEVWAYFVWLKHTLTCVRLYVILNRKWGPLSFLDALSYARLCLTLPYIPLYEERSISFVFCLGLPKNEWKKLQRWKLHWLETDFRRACTPKNWGFQIIMDGGAPCRCPQFFKISQGRKTNKIEVRDVIKFLSIVLMHTLIHDQNGRPMSQPSSPTV